MQAGALCWEGGRFAASADVADAADAVASSAVQCSAVRVLFTRAFSPPPRPCYTHTYTQQLLQLHWCLAVLVCATTVCCATHPAAKAAAVPLTVLCLELVYSLCHCRRHAALNWSSEYQSITCTALSAQCLIAPFTQR